MVKTEIKKLPKSRVEFKITLPWEKWEKYLEQSTAEISKEFKIDGFRPGKAPRNLVEQKVGKGALLNHAAEKAVKKSYVDFILAEKIEAIGQPEVEIEEIKEGKNLEYVARFAVIPSLQVNKKYQTDIKKINENYKNKEVEIKDEEIDSELNKLANSRVKLVTVRREAKKGDSAEIDFSVMVDGVPIENGTSKKHPVIIGRAVFIPGFEENLIGMKENEEKEFELEFPKDYHKKDLAGRKAVFKVKVNLVQERQIPEINDDFAKSLGKFETLEALKKEMREGMEHEGKHKLEDQKRTEYIEKIIENTKTDLPVVLVNQETEKMVQEFEFQVQNTGMNLEQYLSQIKKDLKELKKDWEPQAEKRVISALALQEIVKAESIQVDSKEIEAEMNKTLQYYKNVGQIEKNINLEKLYNYTKGNMENEKVFEYLDKL